MVIYLSLLVALIGLLIHLFVSLMGGSPLGGRFQQIGLGMFLVGLLAFLLQIQSHMVGVIK